MEDIKKRLNALTKRFELGKIDEDVYLQKKEKLENLLTELESEVEPLVAFKEESSFIDRLPTEEEVEDEFILQKELEDKYEELENLRESNISAWKTYGSELSAGGMSADEEKLEKKIKELEKKIYGDNSDND